MDTNLEDIAKIVNIAKPIIDPIISTLIKPSINKLSKWIEQKCINDIVVDNFFENKFIDYLSITLSKCRNINLLIFQNHQIKIDDIYFPLTIISSKDQIRYQIKNFDKNLFENIGKVLISDTAGMGKSTLCKWLCKTVIEENAAIPLLIELRNLSEDHNILDEIFAQFNPIGKDFDRDLIFKFIEIGNFLIILDGFDEIQLKNQEIIIKNIREFINKADKNWFLLTSRPEGSLSAFGDFQNFNIEPLKGNDPFILIKKYDSIAPMKISEQLIKDIREKYRQVEELLGNPFLVSLIYSTYTYNKDIPSNRLSFYEEIYSALYKRHDLSKDGWTRPKKSNLDIHQFRILLRQLAFDTALLRETSYSETKLMDLINKSLEKCPGIVTKACDFIEDIISTVPLFQHDGLKIKWAHKSIQDFFAAEFITYDSKKEDFLNKVYDLNTENFNNVLEFILELDFKAFRKIMIRRLLTDFIKHYETAYQHNDYTNYKKLHLRKSKTFGVSYYIGKRVRKRSNSDFEELFEAYDEMSPEHKLEQNRVLYYNFGKFEYIRISGLKIAIIAMLINKSQKYIKEHYDADPLKISNPEKKMSLLTNDLYYLDDDTDNILNNKANFDKVTYSLQSPIFTPRRFFPLIDYVEAKKELEKINSDVESDNLYF